MFAHVRCLSKAHVYWSFVCWNLLFRMRTFLLSNAICTILRMVQYFRALIS